MLSPRLENDFMNIQSTNRPMIRTASVSRAGKQEYQKAKEEFVAARDEHREVVGTYSKWGGRAAFASGAATLVGVAYLTHLYAPGLEGYGAAFPAVFSGFGVGAAVSWGVQQALKNTDATKSMMEARESFVGQRDSYRDTLLTELNDDGVAAAHNPVWDRLKGYENLESHFVSRADNLLMNATEQLELLADNRQGQGWQRALAHSQDDPAAFSTELGLVQENSGIKDALIKGHGA